VLLVVADVAVVALETLTTVDSAVRVRSFSVVLKLSAIFCFRLCAMGAGNFPQVRSASLN